MSALFASGRIFDLIVVVTLVEAIALVIWRHRTGRGPQSAGLLANLSAAIGLLLAARTALTGGGWPVTALCLLGALLAHLLDLRSRWR